MYGKRHRREKRRKREPDGEVKKLAGGVQPAPSSEETCRACVTDTAAVCPANRSRGTRAIIVKRGSGYAQIVCRWGAVRKRWGQYAASLSGPINGCIHALNGRRVSTVSKKSSESKVIVTTEPLSNMKPSSLVLRGDGWKQREK